MGAILLSTSRAGIARAASGPAGNAAGVAGRTYAAEMQAVAGGPASGVYLTVYGLSTGTPAPEALKQVQLKVYGPDGTLRGVKNYPNVAASAGTVVFDLPQPALLGQLVEAQVVVQTASSANAEVLRTAATVTEFAVNPRHVVTPNFLGYGAQFNMHLYTALNDPDRGFTGNEPPREVANVETKIMAMKPGHVRIFLSSVNYQPANKHRMDSFYKTVELAQRAGATINITWWFITRTTPYSDTAKQLASADREMQQFAGTVHDLIVNNGFSAVQYVTVQNEANDTWMTPPQYEQFCRSLDHHLRTVGIRHRIKFIGGDLVLNWQKLWFEHMAEHMGDILDGWSSHIYWDYWDPRRMSFRLTGIKDIWNAIDPQKRKPLYITEFGARGIRRNPDGSFITVPNPYRNGALTNIDPGLHESGVPVAETNILAWEHAWFNMDAANHGFVTTVKWDAYRAQYDFGYQDHSLIGYRFDPAPGEDRWPLRPAYHMQRLMASVTGAGWHVLGYRGQSGGKLITPFRGPAGETTVFGLNSDGAATTFSIGGLPPETTVNFLIWNSNGSGMLANAGVMQTGRGGAVAVAAPVQSLVAVTTVNAAF